MSDGAGVSGGFVALGPSWGCAQAIEAIDAGKRAIREEATTRFKEIEAWRDAELRKCDAALAALNGEVAQAQRREPRRPTSPVRKPRRRSLKRASREDVSQRCEDVFRFIVAGDEGASSGELGQALGMSNRKVHTALQRLRADDRIEQVGANAATRYVAKRGLGGARGSSGAGNRELDGTPQGRIVETIEERSSATAEELAQTLRLPLDRIHGYCAALQREGEIRMDSRDGRAVYVLKKAMA